MKRDFDLRPLGGPGGSEEWLPDNLAAGAQTKSRKRRGGSFENGSNCQRIITEKNRPNRFAKQHSTRVDHCIVISDVPIVVVVDVVVSIIWVKRYCELYVCLSCGLCALSLWSCVEKPNIFHLLQPSSVCCSK